jgi:hypothetical protein
MEPEASLNPEVFPEHLHYLDRGIEPGRAYESSIHSDPAPLPSDYS